MTQIVSKAVGIDLGTTNSAVAMMNPTDTEVTVHRDSTTKAPTTPSCVWRNPATGELVVGRKAFIRIGREPEPVRSIKRVMGRSDLVSLSGQPTSPEAISAAILGEMRRQIEEDVSALATSSTSWIVESAIVTIPAYFDQPQIDATRKAAELAGLQVLELLHEPTAAACYHCWKTSTRDGVFLVYDLGGGTFDVSVVRCTAGVFEVLGISGNNRLGGDDIDTAMALHLRGVLAAEGWALDLDLQNSEEDQLRFNVLKLLAEGAKKALSDSSEYLLRDNGRFSDQEGNPVIIETLLERAELEEVARPFIERTLPYCHEALEQAGQRAGITLSDVDQVLLAGGSTHMPLVRQLVREALCGDGKAKCAEPVYESVDTVVALGAAIRAAAVGGLAVYDPERTVRVSFRGTATTGATTTSVGGTVEALVPGVELAGGVVRLTTSDWEDETELRESGAFSFTRVPLQPGAESMLTFEIFDGTGRLCATAGRPLTHSTDEVQRPTGGLGSTTLSSKAVLLEVSRGGRRHRRELIPALQALPTSAGFAFSHPGETELVLFPVYQQSRQIQVIKVPVPLETPRGTPINFELHMDKHSLITVRGKIGQHAFEAAVELPPERGLPAAEEAEALQTAFDEAAEFLQPGPRSTATLQWTLAKDSHRAATERGDEAQAIHDFEEMEKIVHGLSAASGVLVPPKTEFDRLVDDCVSLNEFLMGKAAQAGLSHDGREISLAIQAQREEGERAFRASDQQAYGEAILQLEAYASHLAGLYVRVSQGNVRMTDEERATSSIRFGLEEAASVADMAKQVGRPEVAREATSIEEKLLALRPGIGREPGHSLEQIGRSRARLSQLRNILIGQGESGDGRLVEDHSAEDMR